MKYWLIPFLFLHATVGLGQEAFPPACKPITIEGRTVVLTSKEPSLALIYNQSNNDLWITHIVSDPNASAGWSSKLEAGNWSALALDQPSFELSCIESKPGHEQQVPCQDMVTACLFPTVTPPQQLTGTFWAAEDMHLAALLDHLGGRGFKLPALSQ